MTNLRRCEKISIAKLLPTRKGFTTSIMTAGIVDIPGRRNAVPIS